MKSNCDNCCQNSDILQNVILLLPSGKGEQNKNTPPSSVEQVEQQQDPISTRLPIADALAAICCTLWGEAVTTPTTTESEPDPLGVPFKEELELCSTCTESLTLLYNTLLEFRSLCAEKGRVFDRLLELRKIRRKQETVVAVVQLERLPPSSTQRKPVNVHRQRRQNPVPDDEEVGVGLPADPSFNGEEEQDVAEDGNGTGPDTGVNPEILEKLEIEIKEEPLSEPEEVDESESELNTPEMEDLSGQEEETSSEDDEDDEDFVIRPEKKAKLKTSDVLQVKEEPDLSESDPEESATVSKKRRPTPRRNTRQIRQRNAVKRTYSLRRKDPRPPSPCSTITVPTEKSGYYKKIVRRRQVPITFPCTVEGCDKGYHREVDLHIHFRRKHPEIVIKRKRKPRGPSKKPKKETETRTKCPQCEKIMRTDYLREHLMIRHSNEKPCLCDHCGKAYSTPRLLQRHILDRHSGQVLERSFPCPHCDMKFLRNNNRKNHIAAVHEWRDPSICEVCGKQFMHERNMRAHLKTHNEETKSQFECGLCQRMFCRRDALKHHIMTAHEGIKYKKRTRLGPKRQSLVKVLAAKSGQGQNGGQCQSEPGPQQEDDHDHHHLLQPQSLETYQMTTDNFMNFNVL